MKNVLLAVTIALFFISIAAGAECAQQMPFGEMELVDRIILNVENCNVEFEHSEDGKIECQYDDNAIDIDCRLENNTLSININGIDTVEEDRKPVHLYLPFEGYGHFILDADNSNIVIGTVMEANIEISAQNSSFIGMAVKDDQPRQIAIDVQNHSALLLAIDETLDNFRIDVITKDETNHLQIGAAYPEFTGEGEYHYKRGKDEITIHVDMKENCRLELCTVR